MNILISRKTNVDYHYFKGKYQLINYLKAFLLSSD